MSNRRNLVLLVTGAALNLSACSYIQSLFPDKERDYQYTTEIPPLVLPSDLNSGAVAKAAEAPSLLESGPTDEAGPAEKTSEAAEPAEKASEATKEAKKTAEEDQAEQTGTEARNAQPGTEDQGEQTEPEATGQTVPEERPEPKPAAKEEKKDAQQQGTPVELVRFADGERRLRISTTPDKAWHLVSKALSRNSIEVTERDQDQKQFNVRYNPNPKQAEDGSLWDEAIFLFKGFETNEKSYLLKLIPVDDKTDLAITDQDLNPVGDDEAAVKLLRLLGGTIQGN